MKNIFYLKIDYNRIYGLDILRALAILFVVIGHGGYLLPAKARIFTDFFVYDGVTIFFVLSGFLIGGILLKIIQNNFDKYTLYDFCVRRWFRTLPNYFFVLILFIVLNYLFNNIN